MADRWEVVVKPVGRARRVPFGPAGDTLPARFTAHGKHEERLLRVTFRASFDGKSRVKVSSVLVERTDGGSVTPEDLTATQLAHVVWLAVDKAVDKAPGAVRQFRIIGRETGGPSDEQLRLLARMYWLAHVSWGTPRQDVMDAFGLPRSTANHWIRKARERYVLPGPHADEED